MGEAFTPDIEAVARRIASLADPLREDRAAPPRGADTLVLLPDGVILPVWRLYTPMASIAVAGGGGDASHQAGIRARIDALPWFHSIDFGNGIVSPGIAPLANLQSLAEVYFQGGMQGKSVLDVGCWDGFNSVEAFRYGAERVLATDYWVWQNRPLTSRKTTELARELLAPKLEILQVRPEDMTIDGFGQFDVVLFCGVFYHLRNPFSTLEVVAKLAREMLVVETAMDAADVGRPAMIFYPGTELNGDATNWWGPNRACVEGMMRDVGFPRIEFTVNPLFPDRGIFRGLRA